MANYSSNHNNNSSTVVAKILKGGTSVEELRFTTSFTIGRTEGCELQVSESSVSRRHAFVEATLEGWKLKDLSRSLSDLPAS